MVSVGAKRSGIISSGSEMPRSQGRLSIAMEAEPAEIGQPTMPPVRPFRVGGLAETFWVYEGAVRLPVPNELVMNWGEPAGDRAILVTVEYQVCSATTYFPPVLATLDLVVGERPDTD